MKMNYHNDNMKYHILVKEDLAQLTSTERNGHDSIRKRTSKHTLSLNWCNGLLMVPQLPSSMYDSLKVYNDTH